MSNIYGYNSSSAYKLDYEYNLNEKTSNGRLHTRENNTEKNTRAVPKSMPSVKFSTVLKVAFCFAIAFFVVNGYVRINEAYNEVAKLEKEYNNIIATNQALQVKIDKAIDLEQLQTVAGEKYGMARPGRYQVFYVDMEQADVAETHTEKKDSKSDLKMSGVTGTITSALNIFK